MNARLAALFALALAAPGRADEGMWMPRQIPDLASPLDRLDGGTKLADTKIRLALLDGQTTKKLAAVDPKLGDVPVDFLSSVDTTGGSSGSTVLNGRGELVGLLFDGTWETIASDFLFDAESTRSIQVDSRYLLWFLSDVAKAPSLLEELGAPVKAVAS